MKIQFTPDFPTLKQFVSFRETVERSHSYTSMAKQFRANYGIELKNIEVEIVVPDLEPARAEVMGLLDKILDAAAAADLSGPFRDLVDRASAAKETETLLSLLPHIEELGGNAAIRTPPYARSAG